MWDMITLSQTMALRSFVHWFSHEQWKHVTPQMHFRRNVWFRILSAQGHALMTLLCSQMGLWKIIQRNQKMSQCESERQELWQMPKVMDVGSLEMTHGHHLKSGNHKEEHCHSKHWKTVAAIRGNDQLLPWQWTRQSNSLALQATFMERDTF